MQTTSRLERLFFWLSGAATDSLEACPAWERRKYVAFGATVLVPCVFAFIACAYALSTLTESVWVIAPVSLVWSFIILTVDRALLATYRAYQNIFRKLAQFALRLVVATLMGVTIAHPLTLLLFRDTVSAVIEQERQQEIEAVRQSSTQARAALETRIAPLEAQIAAQRETWNATFRADFLDKPAAAGEAPPSEEELKSRAEREGKIAEATAAVRQRLAVLEAELAKQASDHQKIVAELNHWQSEFEREVNGQRSGIIGLGPRAKSIQEDQLAWRRAESARLSGVLESLTATRTALLAEMKGEETRVNAALDAAAAETAARLKDEQNRLDGLRRQVQQQQADQFVGQQNALRETLKAQIDALLAQLRSLQEETARLSADAEARITGLRAEPRRDILTQTLALHALFDRGAEGGRFALIAYLVLSALFMLVDTIPLVVKFFSKPGPYDTLLDCEEVKFDRERLAFLRGFDRYMKQLVDSPFLHVTQNRPLERALIEGVDRSRAAKAFLEHLMDLEQAFQEKMRLEHERLAQGGIAGKAEMLEEMAEIFYGDLRQRMEAFFRDDRRTPVGV
jgi:hypothetical protein